MQMTSRRAASDWPCMGRRRRAGRGGFTLVEVMVALLVIAIALPALLAAVSRQLDGTGYLRDKSVAQWLAGNKLTETRLQLRHGAPLFIGRRSGTSTLAGRDWLWWLESSAAGVDDFYRLEVRVAARQEQRDHPLFTLVGFVFVPAAGVP